MKLFPFLAVWGAIVSTIALTWNIIRDIRDKGKLKLNAFIGKMFPDPKDKDYLVVTIANVGRRPIFVKHLGGETKRKLSIPTLFLSRGTCPRCSRKENIILNISKIYHTYPQKLQRFAQMIQQEKNGKLVKGI